MMNYSKFMMNDDDQYQTEQRIKSPEDDCGLALTHRHGTPPSWTFLNPAMAREFLCQALALVDALHAVGSLGGHWRPLGMDKLARFVAVKGSAKKAMLRWTWIVWAGGSVSDRRSVVASMADLKRHQ